MGLDNMHESILYLIYLKQRSVKMTRFCVIKIQKVPGIVNYLIDVQLSKVQNTYCGMSVRF